LECDLQVTYDITVKAYEAQLTKNLLASIFKLISLGGMPRKLVLVYDGDLLWLFALQSEPEE